MPAGFALLPAMSGHPPPPDEARRGPTRPDQARPGPAGSCSQSSLRIFFNFCLRLIRSFGIFSASSRCTESYKVPHCPGRPGAEVWLKPQDPVDCAPPRAATNSDLIDLIPSD